ncbi:MAG: trypsin-like peptidase domain-containing protein, partial [Tepidiformaceae bacterium]
MEATEDGGDQRERRAVDGLDWRAPLAQPPAAPPEVAPADPEAVPSPVHEMAARTGGRALVAVAAAAALVGGLVSGVAVSKLADDRPAVPSGVAGSTLSVEQTSAVADVAARVRPGVVRVDSVKRAAGGVEHDVGSGVVIDQLGHVITNAHVVLNTESLKVVLSDGTERPAILIGHDYPFTDVAVLQIGPG